MKKKFTLPKEFALKWLEALRSGEYKQGERFLANKGVQTTFCCLGVAGRICGYSVEQLNSTHFFKSELFGKVPNEIVGSSENELSLTLSRLNDGIILDINSESDYNFRVDYKKGEPLKLNFNQIADFIEDNVKFT